MQLCQDWLLSLPNEEPYSNLSINRKMNAKTAGTQPDAEDVWVLCIILWTLASDEVLNKVQSSQVKMWFLERWE